MDRLILFRTHLWAERVDSEKIVTEWGIRHHREIRHSDRFCYLIAINFREN